MKLKYQVLLYSLIYSIFTVSLLVFIFSTLSTNIRKDDIYDVTEDGVLLLSSTIEHELHHLISVVEIIDSNPEVIMELNNSNDTYSLMNDTDRDTYISTLNDTWMNTTDINNPFIQERLDNNVANYLNDIKEHETSFFGEIFLTNEYGVVIASTDKLTTLSHQEKYWWQGAYNDGDFTIYFDDRGYDNSVGAIVLGVVYPIVDDFGDFKGMLKVNVKISGMLLEHIELINDISHEGEYLVVRRDGLIVTQEGYEPLDNYVDEGFNEYLNFNEVIIGEIKIGQENYYFGLSPILMENIEEGAIFGGEEFSIDHSQGNGSGSWVIVYYGHIDLSNRSIIKTIHYTIFISMFVILILTSISYFIGNKFSKPLMNLSQASKELSSGNYNIEIQTKSKGEVAQLYSDFNTLAKSLLTSTTSIENLEKEVNERKLLEAKLIEVSRIDELTKLYNRRAFYDFFDKYYKTALRNKTKIGIIMFDVDDFKNVNDSYGHDVGDETLKSISNTVFKITRSSDIFVRWGGEEFIILLQDMNSKALLESAERVRIAVQKIKTLKVGIVTVSIGATLSIEKENVDIIIKRADEALYEAKAKGKNRVVIL